MTPHARSLIAELDVTLGKTSISRQSDMLRRVTDLFLTGVETFSDDQVAVFDDVMCRLIDKIQRRALIELSGRLAPLAKAPVNVVGRLSSHIDIEVSRPVLEKSPLLKDSDLVDVAGSGSQAHLLAIAGRPQISETVVDALVDRGDGEVTRRLMANRGARASELGFAKLVSAASSDAALAAALAGRQDLPEELRPFLEQALA